MISIKNKELSLHDNIIDLALKNDNLSEQDKKDLAKEIADYMRSSMFGGEGTEESIKLMAEILVADREIFDLKNKFSKEKSLFNCRSLRKLCIKQKEKLEQYSRLNRKTLRLKSGNIDSLIKLCLDFENKTKAKEEEYSAELHSLNEKISSIISKDFKMRTLIDYKNLRRDAMRAKDITSRAEKEAIHIPYLKGMSIFSLDKHIELADKQIQYFENLNAQNEEKLRTLNQEIVSALVPTNERNTNVSLNIIRLCNNMKRQIEFLSGKGAKIPKLRFTDINNLDKCIAIEQKRIDDENERKRKIEADRKRRMQECVSKVVSFDKELAKYSEPANCYNLSFEECQSIISTARKLKREIDYLKENKYKMPTVTWYNPDVLIQKMERRIENIKQIRSEAISDIKSRDQTISGMIHRDYKVLSVDDCRQIIGICKEQKRKIEFYKSKGVRVSGLNNGNMDYLIDKFEDICQNKIKWEKEQKERERQREKQQRERERQQREREKQQKERERQQREKERQQREREKQQREREREKQQRERERQQREQRREREEERKRRAAIEVQEIYDGLKRYTAERLRIQERQDAHWKIAGRGMSQKEELKEDRDAIGSINHEINKLIGRLMRHPKQYSCYKLAMDFLEHEIERCQYIRDDRSEHIKKVARGTASWIRSDGVEHWDNTNQIKYVAHLEDKIKRYKEQLSKLREMNRQ